MLRSPISGTVLAVRSGICQVKLSEKRRFPAPIWVISLISGFQLISGMTWAQFVLREHEVSSSEIRIGMANAQSGPTMADDPGIKEGSIAYFKRVNSEGGVCGRKLTLIDYDDRYEPLETVALTARLINDDKVFALFGFRGTATCDAIASMVRDADIVFFGAFTGTKSIREPSMSMVYNLRPSLDYEVGIVVSHLINDLGAKRIAFLGQADSLGENGESAVGAALQNYGLKIAAIGKYVRNSIDLQAALDQIVPAQPDAVVMAATSRPALQFLIEARKRGLMHTAFFMLSPVAIDRLMEIAGPEAEGIFLSKLVPSPEDASIPCVKEYQHDMRAIGAKGFSHMSLEAYLDAVAFVAGLKAAGPNITQVSLRDALDHLDIDPGGFPIRFTAADHTGSRSIFLSCVHNGHAQPVQTLAWPERRY